MYDSEHVQKDINPIALRKAKMVFKAFLGAIGLRMVQDNRYVSEIFMVVNIMPLNIMFRILDY